MKNHSNLEKFNRWVLEPIGVLKENIENGSGAYIALLVALSLYEAYLRFNKDTKSFDDNPRFPVVKKAATDLGRSESEVKKWWDILRHGLAHQFSPKPGYHFSHKFKAIPEFNPKNGKFELDPWKFVDMVIGIYEKNPDLVENLSLVQAVIIDD